GKVHAFPDQSPGEVDELNKLGPEVLVTPETDPDYSTKEWDLATFRKNIAKIRKSIKEFLLDQKKQAGLGNMYVCEALYQAGVRPDRPANEISAEEAEKILNAAKEILRTSIENELDYDKVLLVYRRDKDPNGNPVESSQVGGRDTFWVPAVQK